MITPREDGFGFGLLYPLKRENGDFRAAGGAELVKSALRKVVAVKAASPDGVMRGEYPWRMAFGSQVVRLLHSNPDETLPDLVRVFVADAVAEYEPRATVDTASTTAVPRGAGQAIRVQITYRLNRDQISALRAGPEQTEVDYG